MDEPTSFTILDAFVDAGFDAIDTADSYSTWVPGNQGGESETIIGNWLKRNPAKRDRVHVMTKVGSGMPATGGKKTLTKKWILEEVEQSLERRAAREPAPRHGPPPAGRRCSGAGRGERGVSARSGRERRAP